MRCEQRNRHPLIDGQGSGEGGKTPRSLALIKQNHFTQASRYTPAGGRFMTRAELQNNQEYMWRALFVEERTTLTLAVEMLLRCHLSPEQILTKTLTALEGLQQDS